MRNITTKYLKILCWRMLQCTEEEFLDVTCHCGTVCWSPNVSSTLLFVFRHSMPDQTSLKKIQTLEKIRFSHTACQEEKQVSGVHHVFLILKNKRKYCFHSMHWKAILLDPTQDIFACTYNCTIMLNLHSLLIIARSCQDPIESAFIGLDCKIIDQSYCTCAHIL